ncbi:MAG: helix-turn-helix domain-containing protein [Actinobacteria bacterium]|nr:helix-turn-helix domain-containing protein [Actinomycetota bacterium]
MQGNPISNYNNLPDYLRFTKAAVILDKHPSDIYKLRDSGKLACVYMDGWRVHKAELLRYIREQTRLSQCLVLAKKMAQAKRIKVS